LASAAKGGNQPAVRLREVTMARRAEGGTPPAAPSPVDQRLRRARVLADRGRLAEARVACEAVRLDHPDALDADLLLAAVCLDMGDTEAALSAVRRALFRNPVSPDAIFLEASLLFRAGDVGRARRRMRQALDGIESLPDDTVLSARSGATVSTVRQLAHAYLAGSE
jgi:tetratricopeptide (TPR) repeat protein